MQNVHVRRRPRLRVALDLGCPEERVTAKELREVILKSPAINIDRAARLPVTGARWDTDHDQVWCDRCISQCSRHAIIGSAIDGDIELLKNIQEALESILRDETRFNDQEMRRYFSRTRQMTLFSDSIVISDLQDKFFGVIVAAMSLSARLLREGILCRGAIVRGKIYHSGRIAFGEGLIRAYDLERNAAVYPRIIVTDELQRRLTESDAQSPLNIRFASMLVRDHDGLWFIDPFHSSSWPGYGSDENPEDVKLRALEKMRTRIDDGLTHVQERKALWEIAKHRWLARRFNVTLAAEGRTEPARIDV